MGNWLLKILEKASWLFCYVGLDVPALRYFDGDVTRFGYAPKWAKYLAQKRISKAMLATEGLPTELQSIVDKFRKAAKALERYFDGNDRSAFSDARPYIIEAQNELKAYFKASDKKTNNLKSFHLLRKLGYGIDPRTATLADWLAIKELIKDETDGIRKN